MLWYVYYLLHLFKYFLPIDLHLLLSLYSCLLETSFVFTLFLLLLSLWSIIYFLYIIWLLLLVFWVFIFPLNFYFLYWFCFLDNTLPSSPPPLLFTLHVTERLGVEYYGICSDVVIIYFPWVLFRPCIKVVLPVIHF